MSSNNSATDLLIEKQSSHRERPTPIETLTSLSKRNMSMHCLLTNEGSFTPEILKILTTKGGKNGIMQIICVATATDLNRGHCMSLTVQDEDKYVLPDTEIVPSSTLVNK